MHPKLRNVIAGALGVGFLAAAAAPQQASAETVTIGHFGVPTPWKLAAANGAFADATGVDIEWRQFDSGAKVISALASGSVDLTALGSSPSAAAIAQDVDLEIFYVDKVFASAEAFAVRDGSGITAPQDLRGKTIAVPLASTTHFHLLFALEQFNIPRSEVEVVNMSPNQAVAAWKRGDVDGAFVWNPALGEILKSGRLLITSGQLAQWGKPTFDGFAADPEFADANPEFMVSFVEALADVNARYNAQKADWTPESDPVQTIANYTGADPQQVPQVLSGIGFLSLDEQASKQWLGGGVATALEATSVFLKNQGKIDTVRDDYGQYVDPSWVEKARTN